MHDQILHDRLDRWILLNQLWQTNRGAAPNIWINTEYTNAYFRLAQRATWAFNMAPAECPFPGVGLGYIGVLELANITVKEGFRGPRGPGVFAGLLGHMEGLNIPLLVENVLVPELEKYFEHRGYQRTVRNTMDEIPSFYYLPQPPK